MYPNLYYIFKDWFGVSWKGLALFNTFGLMVALSFVAAAYTLYRELQRKEKAGLLLPVEERIIVGKGVSAFELITSTLVGFIFGYKIVGAFFNVPPEISMQEYLFSFSGNGWGGLALAFLMGFLKWKDRQKNKQAKPEERVVRIWPHDRVGDFVVLAMVFGILGAKIFDNLEHLGDFILHPIDSLLSASGLTFYGGLILAALAICVYAYRKKISITHLVDAAAPGLMIAYAIGRIGCQVSGDGDWGIYNSAYTSDAYGHVVAADPLQFRSRLEKDSTYFLKGKVMDMDGSLHYVTDRTYVSLEAVPHASVKGSILPDWFFAYSYPGNVNKDGIEIPGMQEEHNRKLPQPVFPTPLYETILCGVFFFVLWFLRKRIKWPLAMFGAYLFLNGVERYFMEKMRVNKLYSLGGIEMSQAAIIAMLLMIFGVVLLLMAARNRNKTAIK